MTTHPHHHDATKLPASPSDSVSGETITPSDEEIDENDSSEEESEDSIRLFWVPMAALHTITVVWLLINKYWFAPRFAEVGIDPIYSAKIIPISIMLTYCARVLMIVRGNDPLTRWVIRLLRRQGRKEKKHD